MHIGAAAARQGFTQRHPHPPTARLARQAERHIQLLRPSKSAFVHLGHTVLQLETDLVYRAARANTVTLPREA